MIKTHTTTKEEINLSYTLKEDLKNLIIDLMVKYPNVSKEFIYNELYNHSYFIKRYKGVY
jgi:hypothetical protein